MKHNYVLINNSKQVRLFIMTFKNIFEEDFFLNIPVPLMKAVNLYFLGILIISQHCFLICNLLYSTYNYFFVRIIILKA